MLPIMIPLLFGIGLMATVMVAEAGNVADQSEDDGAGGPGTDGDDEGEFAPENPGTITIPEAFEARGQFRVPEGLSRVEVNVNAGGTVVDQTGVGNYALQTAEGEDALVISGNDAAETFFLNGSGYILTTGDGADRVEIEGAQDFILDASAGDTVIGPDAADRVGDTADTLEIIRLDTGATYQGGEVGMTVTATGDTATMIGGAGDDVFATYRSATMQGGAGEDTLVAAGAAAETFDDPDAYNQDGFSQYLSGNPSLLDGGAGDDSIFASYASTITGGIGADDITLYLDAGLNGATPPTITDFDRADDTLMIWYDSAQIGFTIPTLVSEIGVTETNGDTIITGRGDETVVLLKGVTGLQIGVTDALGDAPRTYTDLAGSPVALADVDVVIQRFLDT